MRGKIHNDLQSTPTHHVLNASIVYAPSSKFLDVALLNRLLSLKKMTPESLKSMQVCYLGHHDHTLLPFGPLHHQHYHFINMTSFGQGRDNLKSSIVTGLHSSLESGHDR